MKKKLVKTANQIYDLEMKLQNGENMSENMQKLQKLTDELSLDEMIEVNAYLEDKLQNKHFK